MIKKAIRLFRVEMKDILGINKIIHSDKDFKLLRIIGLLVCLLIFSLISCALSYGYYRSLAPSLYINGHIDQVLTIAFASSCLVLFTTNISKAAMSLFSYKDYDILMSLPIKLSSVILSKMTILYTVNLLSLATFIIPSLIVYCHYVYVKAEFFLTFGILMLFIPIIPLTLSTIVSIIVSFLSYNLKNRKIFNTLVTFLLIVFLLFVSNLILRPDFIDKSVVSNIINVSNVFPLSIIFTKALIELNIPYIFLFILASASVEVIFISLIYKHYKNLHLIVTTYKVSSSDTKKIKNEVSSRFKSLFKREVKRYIAVPSYMINTIIGPVTLILICASFVFFFDGYIKDSLNAFSNLHVISIKSVISVAFSVICCIFLTTSCTTSCSISIEGKNYWILQSSPVSYQDIFNSKILLSTLVNSGLMAVIDLLFSIAFRLNFLDIIYSIVIQFSFILFTSVLGILVNLKLPKMEWQNESVVVKQSASVLVSILLSLLGLVINLVSIVIFFFSLVFSGFSVKNSVPLSIFISSFIILLITFLLYKYILKHPKLRQV